jgi:hypothetical protein
MQQVGVNLKYSHALSPHTDFCLVAKRLKPFVVNAFSKFAIRHLCKFFGGHDFFLRNGMEVQETDKAKEK